MQSSVKKYEMKTHHPLFVHINTFMHLSSPRPTDIHKRTINLQILYSALDLTCIHLKEISND